MLSPEPTDFGICVITGAWDDLPALLTRLGYPYRTLGDSLAVCQDPAALQGCRALYIACGAECEMTDMAAYHIGQFVERGGGLYVSDLAAPVIERIFPGLITFSKLDYRSDNPVRVLDPALAARLGHTITLHMDYQSSQGIQATAAGVEVLLQGKRQDFDEREYPYLVTFRRGQGQVLYTVFHNAYQINETEARLLHYLVMRPLLTAELARAHQVITARQSAARPEMALFEAIGSAGPDRPAETYTLRFERPGRARIGVVWPGRASFAVKVTGPNGQRVTYYSSDDCPLAFDFSASKAGEYTCEVQGIHLAVPYHPYVFSAAAPP